jgi:predicted permease
MGVRRDRDLDKELRFHVEEHVRDLIAAGLSPEEARRRAQLDMGGINQIKERIRDARRGAWLDRLRGDARDAWRGLRRTPGPTLTAVALVALVIGGNTTLFTMIHGILAKPARGVRADRLVTLEPRTGGQVGFGHSFPDYLELVGQARTLSRLLACDFAPFTISVADGTYAVRGARVTPNYFDTLGVRLIRGRSFTDEESRLDSSGLTAVVSHRVWQEQFHGIEDIVGQPIAIDGHAATVIGVAPEGFQGTTLAELSQVWVPLVAYSRVEGTSRELGERQSATLFAIGRLAPGVSLSEAQAEVSGISARLAAAYPQTNANRTVRLVSYSVTAGGNSIVALRGSMFLAVCAVITVLTVLIVCANVANLMLARAAVRQRETALRRSLGASRLSIVRSLVFEGLAVSAVACAAAYVFAVWTSRAVLRLFPPAANGAALPLDFSPDWRVAAYAALVALLGTVAFTLPPAFRVWRLDLLPFLKAGEQGVVQGRTKLSSALVIVQLAFAVLLLTCAGLAYRSISLISTRDLGFSSDNLMLVTVSTTGASSTGEASAALLERVRERLRTAPRLRAVSYGRYVPTMPGALWPDPTIAVPGGQPARAWMNAVGPEYLRTLGLSPLAGREFSESERGGEGAMINRELANTLWPGESAVGRTLLMGPERRPLEVIGVVPDALFSGYGTQMRPSFIFLSARRGRTQAGPTTFYVRYSGTLESAVAEVRRALRDVDTRIPIVYNRTLHTELDAATWPVRFIYVLLTLFAGVSLMVATIGQYAVITFDVRRRTRDFGVRMALGASRGRIVTSVVRQGLVWSAVGLTVGSGLSLAAGRALRSVLFGITPTDGRTWLSVLTVLLATSLLACYLPARRAAQVDPMTALREE